jgi:hypothetical protein
VPEARLEEPPAPGGPLPSLAQLPVLLPPPSAFPLPSMLVVKASSLRLVVFPAEWARRGREVSSDRGACMKVPSLEADLYLHRVALRLRTSLLPSTTSTTSARESPSFHACSTTSRSAHVAVRENGTGSSTRRLRVCEPR